MEILQQEPLKVKKPALKRLDLSKNYLKTKHCLCLLAPLESPECNLQELRLRDNNLDDEFGIKLLQSLVRARSLQVVCLARN